MFFVLNFEFLNFGFVSDFGFRIYYKVVLVSWCLGGKVFLDFFSFTEFQDSYGSLNDQDKNNGPDDQVRFV